MPDLYLIIWVPNKRINPHQRQGYSQGEPLYYFLLCNYRKILLEIIRRLHRLAKLHKAHKARYLLVILTVSWRWELLYSFFCTQVSCSVHSTWLVSNNLDPQPKGSSLIRDKGTNKMSHYNTSFPTTIRIVKDVILLISHYSHQVKYLFKDLERLFKMRVLYDFPQCHLLLSSSS